MELVESKGNPKVHVFPELSYIYSYKYKLSEICRKNLSTKNKAGSKGPGETSFDEKCLLKVPKGFFGCLGKWLMNIMTNK